MVKNPNPLATLWKGNCTIYEYQKITDPETHQTTHDLVEVVTDEPCRLSQNRVSHNRSDLVSVSDVPYVDELIVLFIRPDLKIKAGSVIEVTQNNVTNKYRRSSQPAIYTNHQEVTLERYEENA